LSSFRTVMANLLHRASRERLGFDKFDSYLSNTTY
jgi:hypothetical protein